MAVTIPSGTIVRVFEAYDHAKVAKDSMRAKAASLFSSVIVSGEKQTGNAKQRRTQRRKIESIGMVSLHRRGVWVELKQAAGAV